jgi:hypothetical protein
VKPTSHCVTPPNWSCARQAERRIGRGGYGGTQATDEARFEKLCDAVFVRLRQRAGASSSASRLQRTTPSNPSVHRSAMESDPRECEWKPGGTQHSIEPRPPRRPSSLDKRKPSHGSPLKKSEEQNCSSLSRVNEGTGIATKGCGGWVSGAGGRWGPNPDPRPLTPRPEFFNGLP